MRDPSSKKHFLPARKVKAIFPERFTDKDMTSFIKEQTQERYARTVPQPVGELSPAMASFLGKNQADRGEVVAGLYSGMII
jgi:chromatin remodeling complex protein RSC6